MHKEIIAKLALLCLLAYPSIGFPADARTEKRLRELEEKQRQLERAVKDRDEVIKDLERARREARSAGSRSPQTTGLASDYPQDDFWSRYEPGNGFKLAQTPYGDLTWSAFTYARYLNQRSLDPYYTDSFGREFELDRRHDMQLQKVTMYFKGWLLDPKFHYLLYTWTSNSNQGQSAQVVVAGNLGYKFNDNFNLSAGINSLPSTRSTQGTFPDWLRVDHRTIADEFFRASYTSGIWASGDITKKSRYQLMLGNNLSQLGVDANQLDEQFNTVSGAAWVMPTTGEYGPKSGFGDYEYHENLATLFGASYTRSREDAQAQPGINSFENSQIRLSDGTLLFQLDPFDVGSQVDRATYQMASVNGGLKKCGYSLDAEYYWRKVDNFETSGPIPVDALHDHGFQLQASAMLVPSLLQLYLSGSKIYGDYGNPWDVALGANIYPFKRREVRVNTQVLYLKDSPVGYNSVPFIVGGDGAVLSIDLMLAF
ncbi:hypothetical protein [Microbulbifer sp. SAOS-129_SWC]|uniref:hypothetical protein n=1 Tax=Microbulbifer sp. SAOS-129_SWC TaxID=3145235 RepID=UPI00321683C2